MSLYSHARVYGRTPIIRDYRARQRWHVATPTKSENDKITTKEWKEDILRAMLTWRRNRAVTALFLNTLTKTVQRIEKKKKKMKVCHGRMRPDERVCIEHK